ncbi:unnamed protein product [Adineta steineri]|uniref:Uncharacterized protein n=1 Tax=Adineta steineri TaxID=433720 RepID=A0A814NYD0_9BILA|nr:unnamed protein product [Adineta steineri]CAF4159230.1 unnamed protein product [Adineta steineri]
MNEKLYLEYLPGVKSSRSFSRQQITSSVIERLAQTCRIACGIVGLSNADGEYYCEADIPEDRIHLLIGFSHFDDENVQHQALEYMDGFL